MTTPAPLHLNPNPEAQFHPNVLLPGDPARAMAIAHDLLEDSKMFNHRRGLWGYSGLRKDNGQGLLIQSTGMGGPSAAIICEELVDLGAEVIVRVGTGGALADDIALGDLIVVTDALAFDGASRALGAGDRVAADPELTERLVAGARKLNRSATHYGPVASTDLFYEKSTDREQMFRAAGALAVEMECATVHQVAASRGVRAACVLGVTDTLAGDGTRQRMEAEGILELGVLLGRVGVVAVG